MRILCSLFLGLCVDNVNVNRLNILFYANLLLLARGAEGLLAFRRESAAGLLACYGLLAALFFTQYFTAWAERMETVFYRDFLNAVAYAGELDGDVYYITPNTQSSYSANVSEILTLFALETDAEYFQGRTAEHPGYTERYHYRDVPLDALPDGPGRTVCVVRGGAEAPPDWQERTFGSYRVLWREG